MKKWQAVIIAGATVSAAASAVYYLKRKNGDAQAEEGKKKQIPEPKNPGTAEYGFVSGYNNTETVKVAFNYDADKFVYRTIEEEFLTYTDNAHVGALYGEELNLQLEYTDFIAGENFSKHTEYLSEKYKGFKKVQYGANSGFMYYDGDSTCFVFPASDFSCLLISVLLGKNSKLTQAEVYSSDDVSYILSTLKRE